MPTEFGRYLIESTAAAWERPGSGSPWFLDPAYKLLLVNANNTADRYRAIFNPNELTISVDVGIGKLQPIGWSHPVKQYAHTNEVKVPMKFWLSSLAMTQWPPYMPGSASGLGVGAADVVFADDVRGPVTWLQSFCYAEGPGLAPPHMIIMLPNNLCIRVAVEGVTVKYLMWDGKMIPRIAEVDLNASEARVGFRYRSEFLTNGFVASYGMSTAAAQDALRESMPVAGKRTMLGFLRPRTSRY